MIGRGGGEEVALVAAGGVAVGIHLVIVGSWSIFDQ